MIEKLSKKRTITQELTIGRPTAGDYENYTYRPDVIKMFELHEAKVNEIIKVLNVHEQLMKYWMDTGFAPTPDWFKE